MTPTQESTMDSGRLYVSATIALLLVLATVNCYRAASQSFTSVERAAHWKLLIGPPEQPDPGLRIRGLGSLVSETIVKIFGLSEFTLRFADFAGGLLYLTAIFLLCRLALGNSAWLLFGVALSTLNPLLLDFCSMASGRGLGLGCWTLGAYFVARWAAGRQRIPILTGVLLGFAISSDFQQLFAVTTLSAVFIAGVVLSRLRARDGKGAVRFLIRDALLLCLTAAATVFAFVWTSGPLTFQDQTAKRFLNGLKSLVTAVLLYRPTFLTSPDTIHRLLARLGWIPAAVLPAVLCLATLWIAVRWWRGNPADRLERLLMLFSATAAGTGALLWFEPWWTHSTYFSMRGLVFAQPLFSVAAVLLLRWASSHSMRAAAAVGTISAGLALALFVLQFQPHSYYGSEWESGVRSVVRAIQSRHPAESEQEVLVATPTRFTPVLHAYRRMRDMDWLKQTLNDNIECHADFYYLPEEHFDRLGALGLHAISRDQTARMVFADLGQEAKWKLAALREAGFAGTPQCNAGLLSAGSWIDGTRAGAARHFLRDIEDRMEPDQWRWTYERPAMLLQVPNRQGWRFKMDFVIHKECFRGKLPLEVTVWINGREVGMRRFDSPEYHTLELPVPPEVLRSDGVALVETTLNRYCVAAEDGKKLGYLFIRGGFVN